MAAVIMNPFFINKSILWGKLTIFLRKNGLNLSGFVFRTENSAYFCSRNPIVLFKYEIFNSFSLSYGLRHVCCSCCMRLLKAGK